MVTGSTGFIGSHLTQELLSAGHYLHLLIRGDKARVYPAHPQIKIFQGDILNHKVLDNASLGCEQIYHLAGLASVWAPDNRHFYQINSHGTDLICQTALRQGISKVVFSSTAGTFGPSDAAPVNENTLRTHDFFNSYESSKFIAEERALHYYSKGLQIVTVNPSRVYGPGLLSESNPFTRLMRLYLQRKWRIMPGNGQHIGNYVFIQDVVLGLIAAMDRGIAGEKYLLGGQDISYSDFFKILGDLSGKRIKLNRLPLSLLKVLSTIQVLKAKTLKKKPLITPQWVNKYYHNWAVSSAKATNALNYSYRPLDQGMKITLDWLYDGNYI